MLKLETIHQAMNNHHVLEIVHSLHFDWILEPFDVDDPAVRKCIKKMFRFYTGHEATDDQVLAVETLFRIRVETGQSWRQ